MGDELKPKPEFEEALADDEKPQAPTSEILSDSARVQLETAFTNPKEITEDKEPTTTILSIVFPGHKKGGYAEEDDDSDDDY